MSADPPKKSMLVSFPGSLLIAAVNVAFGWTAENDVIRANPKAIAITVVLLAIPSMLLAWFLPAVLSKLSSAKFLPETLRPNAEFATFLTATAMFGFVVSELILCVLKGGWHEFILPWILPTTLVFLVAAHRQKAKNSPAEQKLLDK